jgi:hypothetical protein
MKLEFSRQIFEKYSNVITHENPSSGSRIVPCGRTDGHYSIPIHNSRTSSKSQQSTMFVRSHPNCVQSLCYITLTHVPRNFYYFVLWPTNAQLFQKLSNSYMFRHYRVILRELVINTLQSYTGISHIPGQHDSSINTQIVYTATTPTDFMRTVATKWF